METLIYFGTARVSLPQSAHAGHDWWLPVAGLTVGRITTRDWFALEQLLATEVGIVPHVLDPASSLPAAVVTALQALKVDTSGAPTGGFALRRWLHAKLKWPALSPLIA